MSISVVKGPSHERGGDNLHPAAFGVYRPLDPDFSVEFGRVVSEVVEEARDYLGKCGREGRQNVRMHNDFGATFVSRRDVSLSLADGLLGWAYDPDEAVAALGRYDLLDDQVLEVPLGSVDLFKPRSLKVGTYLQRTGAGKAELDFQSQLVGAWLDELCVQEADIPVRQPDHVAFMRVGAGAWGEPLNDDELFEVEQIIDRRFKAQGITALYLGPLLIGRGYSFVHPDYEAAFAHRAISSMPGTARR